MCNNVLREDQIGYIFCHTNIQTDVDGVDKRVIAVLGKKSVSRPPEAFFPIVLTILLAMFLCIGAIAKHGALY